MHFECMRERRIKSVGVNSAENEKQTRRDDGNKTVQK